VTTHFWPGNAQKGVVSKTKQRRGMKIKSEKNNIERGEGGGTGFAPGTSGKRVPLHAQKRERVGVFARSCRDENPSQHGKAFRSASAPNYTQQWVPDHLPSHVTKSATSKLSRTGRALGSSEWLGKGYRKWGADLGTGRARTKKSEQGLQGNPKAQNKL